MQYTEIFGALIIRNFQLKNFDIFLIFCSKHGLWVHVRTAWLKNFDIFLIFALNIDCGYTIPTIYVLDQK